MLQVCSIMLRGSQLQRLGCHQHRGLPSLQPISRQAPFTTRSSRLPSLVVTNLFGKGKGDEAGKEDAARKALESAFGSKKKKSSSFGQKKETPPAADEPATDTGKGGFNFGGFNFGGGGGGGSGGSGNSGDGMFQPPGEGGPEKPIGQEIKELLWGAWVTGVNCLIFLAFVDWMHRSLDYFATTELLLWVGAKKQAFEMFVTPFFNMVEWVQENAFGWKIPRDDNTMPMHEYLANYLPPEHSYSFAQYKYDLDGKEKETMRNVHGVRWYERKDGKPGDVTQADVDEVLRRHDPAGYDLQQFERAKSEGRLAQYWEERKDMLAGWTGDAEYYQKLAAKYK